MDENDRTRIEQEEIGTNIKPEPMDALGRFMEPWDCKRVSILQELLASAHLPGHGKRQAKAVQELGITIRSHRKARSGGRKGLDGGES